MKKNLISVSQLTRDSNVVEFHFDSCLVKDKDIRMVLIQGLPKDGLYELAPTFDHAMSKSFPPIKPKAFTTSVSSLNKCKPQLPFSHGLSSTVNVVQNNNVCQQWHARLGHPSFSVL